MSLVCLQFLDSPLCSVVPSPRTNRSTRSNWGGLLCKTIIKFNKPWICRRRTQVETAIEIAGRRNFPPDLSGLNLVYLRSSTMTFGAKWSPHGNIMMAMCTVFAVILFYDTLILWPRVDLHVCLFLFVSPGVICSELLCVTPNVKTTRVCATGVTMACECCFSVRSVLAERRKNCSSPTQVRLSLSLEKAPVRDPLLYMTLFLKRLQAT